MAKRRRIRENVKLHPVMTFLLLVIVVIVLSGVLGLFNAAVIYKSISASKMEYTTSTTMVRNLFNLSGVKYIFSSTVSNFANFTVLSNLIIVLLGIGVMEYSGFLKTAVGFLTRHSKKNHTTYVIVLICLLSSLLGNLPFIAFIPLAALIYKYGKRNPNLGVIASFASMSCGYGLSILLTALDSTLADTTVMSASFLDPTYHFKTFSLILIMTVAILILSFAITHVVENHLTRILPKYDFEDTEVLSTEKLTRSQQRGLLFAVMGSVLYLLIFLYNIIPGLPLSGNFLNHDEVLYINKLFGNNSFFANGFVFIVTMLFIIWGLLYGIGSKSIKNNRDFIDSLGYSLNGIGKTLVYIFASATFISVFKHSNIGNVIVAWLTNIVANSQMNGIFLCILFFIVGIIATLFVPTSASRWTIMAPSIVPVFLNIGVSAEFTQVIFRFSECVGLGLTPLFAYFIIYLAYLEKYSQDERSLSLTSAIKYQLPFSLVTFGVLFSIIIIWYLISLPLGIGGSVAL